jgi:hypothetical protein
VTKDKSFCSICIVTRAMTHGIMVLVTVTSKSPGTLRLISRSIIHLKTWTHHGSMIILIQEEYATNLGSLVVTVFDFLEGLESSGRNDIEVCHVLASGSYSFCLQVSTFSNLVSINVAFSQILLY